MNNSTTSTTYTDMNNSTIRTNLSSVPLISMDECERTIEYINIILYILATLGIAGNMISFVVLYRNYPKTVGNLYLKALAITDTIVLTSALLAALQDCMTPGTLHYTVYHLVVYFFINDTSQLASVWLIVILAAARLIAVAMPLKVSSYITMCRARISIAVIFAVATILEIARLSVVIECDIIDDGNNTIYDCYHDFSLQRNITIMALYFGGCFFILPAIPLIFSSVGLLVTLRRASGDVTTSTPNLQNDSRGITKIIISIVTVFFISYFPFFIWSLSYIEPHFENYILYRRCDGLILDTSLYVGFHVNSSVNFIIYLLWKESFRQKCYNLMKCSRGNALVNSPTVHTTNSNTHSHQTNTADV